MMSAAEIIAAWPSAERFAADLGLKYPSYGRVMKMRNSIPRRYWSAVLSAAANRGISLSRADLEAAHVPRVEPSEERAA